MGRLLTVTKDSILVEEYQYDLNGTRILRDEYPTGYRGKNCSATHDEDHLLTAGSYYPTSIM